MCLGGDHEKGTYLFMVILLIRYKSNNKKLHRLELKIGEINEEKDKIEYLEELIKKVSPGLRIININKKGDCYVNISQLKDVTYNSTALENAILIKFYLTGDTKGIL